MIRVARLQRRLEVTEVKHPLAEHVAEQDDVLALRRLQRERDGGGFGRSGGRLRIGRQFVGGLWFLGSRLFFLGFRRRRAGSQARAFAQNEIGDLQVPFLIKAWPAVEPVERRLERIDVAHVRLGRHLQPGEMVNRIDHEPAQILAREIHRSAERGAKRLALRRAVGRGVFAQPGQRHHGIVLRPLDGFRCRVQRRRHRAAQENGGRLLIEILDAVHIARTKHILHAIEHHIRRVRRLDDAARALATVRAVMADPGFAENLQPELRPLEVVRLPAAREGVRGRAEADDRLARVEEVGHMLVLFRRPLAKARADDEQVGLVQRGDPGNALLIVRVDELARRVEGEQHGAIKPMPLAENLAQHRHALLGTILLVARNEHDVTAFTGTILPLERQRILRACHAECEAGEYQ